jgi:two-component system, OmpR family, sensor kinase
VKHEPDPLRAEIAALRQQRNDFIAKLVHDIRGPLTSIFGFAELLEEGMLEGQSALDAAKTIRTNAAKLTQLTADLLAMNRAEPGNFELVRAPMDLSKLVADVAGVAVEPGVSIVGDEPHLRTAFEQLMANAKKFSRNGKAPSISLQRRGADAVVTIADAGIGIPAAEIACVGERFYRATNAKKEKLAGTGIGVYVAKAYVEAHGGRVEIASDGSGTTVTVSLPLAEP